MSNNNKATGQEKASDSKNKTPQENPDQTKIELTQDLVSKMIQNAIANSKDEDSEESTGGALPALKKDDKERLKAIFKGDQTLTKVYQTSDVNFFKMKGLAVTHARTLENKKIQIHLRSN